MPKVKRREQPRREGQGLLGWAVRQEKGKGGPSVQMLSLFSRALFEGIIWIWIWNQIEYFELKKGSQGRIQSGSNLVCFEFGWNIWRWFKERDWISKFDLGVGIFRSLFFLFKERRQMRDFKLRLWHNLDSTIKHRKFFRWVFRWISFQHLEKMGRYTVPGIFLTVSPI